MIHTHEGSLHNRSRLRHNPRNPIERLHGLRQELTEANSAVTTAQYALREACQARQVLSTAITETEHRLAADQGAEVAAASTTAATLTELAPRFSVASMGAVAAILTAASGCPLPSPGHPAAPALVMWGNPAKASAPDDPDPVPSALSPTFFHVCTWTTSTPTLTLTSRGLSARLRLSVRHNCSAHPTPRRATLLSSPSS